MDDMPIGASDVSIPDMNASLPVAPMVADASTELPPSADSSVRLDTFVERLPEPSQPSALEAFVPRIDEADQTGSENPNSYSQTQIDPEILQKTALQNIADILTRTSEAQPTAPEVQADDRDIPRSQDDNRAPSLLLAGETSISTNPEQMPNDSENIVFNPDASPNATPPAQVASYADPSNDADSYAQIPTAPAAPDDARSSFGLDERTVNESAYTRESIATFVTFESPPEIQLDPGETQPAGVQNDAPASPLLEEVVITTTEVIFEPPSPMLIQEAVAPNEQGPVFFQALQPPADPSDDSSLENTATTKTAPAQVNEQPTGDPRQDIPNAFKLILAGKYDNIPWPEQRGQQRESFSNHNASNNPSNNIRDLSSERAALSSERKNATQIEPEHQPAPMRVQTAASPPTQARDLRGSTEQSPRQSASLRNPNSEQSAKSSLPVEPQAQRNMNLVKPKNEFPKTSILEEREKPSKEISTPSVPSQPSPRMMQQDATRTARPGDRLSFQLPHSPEEEKHTLTPKKSDLWVAENPSSGKDATSPAVNPAQLKQASSQTPPQGSAPPKEPTAQALQAAAAGAQPSPVTASSAKRSAKTSTRQAGDEAELLQEELEASSLFGFFPQFKIPARNQRRGAFELPTDFERSGSDEKLYPLSHSIAMDSPSDRSNQPPNSGPQ